METKFWAEGKFRGDATTITADGVSCARVGGEPAGAYLLTLENPLGRVELCPVVTPWVTGAATLVIFSAEMAADGTDFIVRFYSLAGVLTDSAFSIRIDRIVSP